jgi:translation elongation factor EF-1alpha
MNGMQGMSNSLKLMNVAVVLLCECTKRFEEFIPNDHRDYQCYEVTALFTMSGFQYIIMAVVFAKGAPYRKSMFTNCKSVATVQDVFDEESVCILNYNGC